MASDVAALRNVIATLEKLNVRGWDHADTCQLIEYADDAAFSTAPQSDTCRQRVQPVGMTERARRDWAEVDQATSAAGVRVFTITEVYYDHGSIVHADFLVVAPWQDRWAYIYDTGTGLAPDDSGPDVVVIPIDSEWHFSIEDWN